MKITVTPSDSFIGKNLIENLKNIRDGKNRTRPNVIISDVYTTETEDADVMIVLPASANVGYSDDNKSEKVKSKVAIETIIASRSPSPFNGKCQFILPTEGFVLANEDGMENTSLPWSNKEVSIIVYGKDNNVITNWKWEYTNS